MANQPIPVSTANAMIETYLNYMSHLGVDMERQTHSVAFSSGDLKDWMDSVVVHADEFRICLGVYPSGPNAGRISTIIWPYYNGQPATDEQQNEIEPFNDGNGHP